MVVVYTGVSLIGRKGSMTVVAQNQFPYGDFLKLMDTCTSITCMYNVQNSLQITSHTTAAAALAIQLHIPIG